MPEGDTIFRTAASLRKVLAGRTIQKSVAAPDRLQMPDRANHVVEEVESRGKHLLLHFDDNHILHSHMGMTGSWHIYMTDQAWSKPASHAACSLSTQTYVVVCFFPKTIEFLTAAQLRRHRHLSQLGPDLMAPSVSLDSAIERLRQQPATAIGEALMDQRAVSGIGNVYKSEILFLCHIHPLTPVGELADQQLERLLTEARRWLLQNQTGFPRRTRFADGGRHWVYRRAGQHCMVCGEPIRLCRQGSLQRSTYYCPMCQPEQPSIDWTANGPRTAGGSH